MSLSYSAIKTKGGIVTLPSVGAWGTNINIIKDPYKSIHTRRIDKVGDTSSLTQMIDDSGNRSCEAILEYARGQNPMVSVSYSNSNGAPAKLPYTIMKDGAFRPPLKTQRDLLPLSRLPRESTCVVTKPEFIDFSKKLRTCGTAEQTVEVHNKIIQTCARPTAVYNLSSQATKPFEVKYVIQNPVKTAVTSGMKTIDLTQQNVKVPTKEVSDNIIYPFALSNMNDTTKYVNNTNVNTDKYIIEDNINTVGTTNSSASYIQISSIEDVFDKNDIRTKEVLGGSYATNIQGNKKYDYIHENLELNKKLPEYMTRTNVNDNTKYVKIQHENQLQFDRNIPQAEAFSNINSNSRGREDSLMSREVKLLPKISPGGFTGNAVMPVANKVNIIRQLPMNNKSNLNKKVTFNLNSRVSK